MSNQNDENKRERIRVDFETQIDLRVDTSEFEFQASGSSKDLSIKGIFVKTKNDIPAGTKCHVEILLTGMTEKLVLQMQGKVIRKNHEGVAILFDSMDLKTFTHLKNLVRYNATDPDDIY
jgi:hypothetical protein